MNWDVGWSSYALIILLTLEVASWFGLDSWLWTIAKLHLTQWTTVLSTQQYHMPAAF